MAETKSGRQAVAERQATALALDARARGLIGRVLADWVRPRWPELSGAFVLMAALAAVTGFYPRLIKHAFDVLPQGRVEQMYLTAGLIVGATCARAVLLYLTTVASSRIVLAITVDMQKAAVAHLLKADFARLTRDAPGELISRLTNDVAQIQTALQAALNTAVRDGLMIVALVAYMVWSDPLLSGIVLGIYPLAVLPIMTIGRRLKRVARATQEELADMLSLLAEKLGGVRLIKTFRLEDYAAGRMISSFEEIFRLRMKTVRNRARLDPLLEALGGFAVAGVIALATWRIAAGIATIGDFMAFVSALVLAAQPTRGLGNLSVRVQEGLAAAERVYALLDERPTIADRPGASPLVVREGAIAFERVAFAYESARGQNALHDLDLVVPGGQTFALVGRSGAGKSTLINLVPRLFDVTAGRITIDGQDIRDVTLASLRGAIAMVSQDVTLFDDTIRANIELGRLGASEDEIVAAAKAAAAHDFILEQPQGYDTVIGDRGSRLSGGQRQRLALARAILKDAPILLLDEATSALDSESERLVQAALARFTRGRTTLVIAHRLSTVQGADRICVMQDGRIVEAGSHAELMVRSGLYARLARTQLQGPEPRDAAQ
ncbi:MAG: ABC transporter ATP-binding protein [Hyphomicrobiaceae bacterium]|nr:ABC transporter ATP-binding protein [Hyphomicrobiaceae bacterium]